MAGREPAGLVEPMLASTRLAADDGIEAKAVDEYHRNSKRTIRLKPRTESPSRNMCIPQRLLAEDQDGIRGLGFCACITPTDAAPL